MVQVLGVADGSGGSIGVEGRLCGGENMAALAGEEGDLLLEGVHLLRLELNQLDQALPLLEVRLALTAELPALKHTRTNTVSNKYHYIHS